MPECRVLTYLGNKRHCLCLSQGEKLIWTEYSGGMEEKESGIVILVWKRHWVRTEAEDNAVWLGCLCQMPGHGASVWGNLGIWAQGNSTSYQIREPRRDKMAFFFHLFLFVFKKEEENIKINFQFWTSRRFTIPDPSDNVHPGMEFEDVAWTRVLNTRVTFKTPGADEIMEEWAYLDLEGGRGLALGAMLSENKGEEWDSSGKGLER